jgi:hypothetical protein
MGAIAARRAELQAIVGGRNGAAPADNPTTARLELEEIFGLNGVGRSIQGARIVGQGSRASVDVRLDDGTELGFDSLRDVATPRTLMCELAAGAGATPTIKAPQALRAVALLRALADHEHTLTIDHLSVEWGTNYLQHAPVQDVDMGDQADRWRAFVALRRIDPVAAAQREGMTIAAASVVLRHTDGTRLVRCGWFRSHARAEDSTVSPQEIAHRMRRVGWQQRGTAGRIKATCPGRRDCLTWTFYSIEPGWEERR